MVGAGGSGRQVMSNTIQGAFRDFSGNKLHPETIADKVLVRAGDGVLQTLSILLADLGIIPAIIREETLTLQGDLEAGDLYTVLPYAVGNMRLQIWIDGAYAVGGENGVWEEHGEAGEISTTILIRSPIAAGRVITVRAGERVEYFATGVSDSLDSTSSTTAASSLAVKTAWDEASEMDFAIVEAGSAAPENLRDTGIYFHKTL